jgi:hypothetical protein
MDPNKKPAYIHYFPEREHSKGVAATNMTTSTAYVPELSLSASFASALSQPENSQTTPSTSTWIEVPSKGRRNNPPRYLGKEKVQKQSSENARSISEIEGTPHYLTTSFLL